MGLVLGEAAIEKKLRVGGSYSRTDRTKQLPETVCAGKSRRQRLGVKAW